MALYAKSLHRLLLIVSIMLLLLLFFPSLFLFSERLSKLKTIHLLFWKAGYQLKFIFFRLSFFIANFDTTSVEFSSVQSLSRVPLFETLLTATHQASLFITNSRGLLRLMSIESVMPFSHLILCHPPSPPAPNPSQHQGLLQ